MISPHAFAEFYRSAVADGQDVARSAATWCTVDPADALTLTADVDPKCEDRYAPPAVDDDCWRALTDWWDWWTFADPAPWELPLAAALERVAGETYRETYRHELDLLAAAVLVEGRP